MEDPSPRDDTLNGVVSTDAPPTLPHCQLTAAELVAKSIAPVKREFLRPPPARNCDKTADNNSDDKEAPQAAAPAPILKDKNSKRQMKRDRRQVS